MGVYGRSETEELQKLMDEGQVQWPCIRDLKIETSSAWGVATWPANFLIDQHGIVHSVNEFDELKLKAAIEKLLQ